MFVQASIYSEIDNMKGVSGNIMLGQPVKCGTGSVDVLFDEESYLRNMLLRSKRTEEDSPPIPSTIEDKESYCADLNLDFTI